MIHNEHEEIYTIDLYGELKHQPGQDNKPLQITTVYNR